MWGLDAHGVRVLSDDEVTALVDTFNVKVLGSSPRGRTMIYWIDNQNFFYFTNGRWYKNGMIYGWDGGLPVMDY